MAIAAEHDGKALERSLQVPAGARGLRATPRARGRALTRRLLFAQLAPLVLLALAVCAIYAVHALQRVPAASTAHALALSVSLGQAAEFGVFARRVSSLDGLLQRALQQPGVVAAVVYDQAGNAIVARGEASVLAPALIVGSDSPRVLAERAGRLVVAAPIVIDPLDVGDASGSGDRARVANLAETIGWVQVDVDSGRDTPGAGGAGLWILLSALGAVASSALLGEVAALIGQRMRAQDLICRIGGDEFALILRGCSPEDARRIAEDLCTAVGALNFEWEGKSFHIGASVGLARIDDPLNTPSAVLKAADTACYAAKRTGRSQVMEYCATLSC